MYKKYAPPLSRLEAETPSYTADEGLRCCGSSAGQSAAPAEPGLRAMATEQAEAARLRPAA